MKSSSRLARQYSDIQGASRLFQPISLGSFQPAFDARGYCRREYDGVLELEAPPNPNQESASVTRTYRLNLHFRTCIGPSPSQHSLAQIEQRTPLTVMSNTYVAFLDQVLVPAFYRRGHRVFLIQDNASYHKKQETYEWFAQNRRYVEVFQLPPYSPELNATERIWNYTRKHATHNRYFEEPAHLCRALFRTFRQVQRHPEEIANLMQPFF